MIETLEYLIEQIKGGEVVGFVLAFKFANKYLAVALGGRYKEEPARALGLIARMSHRVNSLIDTSPPGPRGGDNVHEIRQKA